MSKPKVSPFVLSAGLCVSLTVAGCLPQDVLGSLVPPSPAPSASSPGSAASSSPNPQASVTAPVLDGSRPADCPADFATASAKSAPDFRILQEGDRCSAILANGAFDSLKKSGTTNFEQISSLNQENQRRVAHVDKLCKTDFKSTDKDVSGSGKVSAIGYGSAEGSYSRAQAETLQTKMCSNYSSDESTDEKLKRYNSVSSADTQFLDQAVASPVITQAWSQCISDTEERKIGLSSSISEDNNGNIFFKVKWNANLGVSSVQVTNFFVTGAEIPVGQIALNKCSRITTAEQTQVLRRTSPGNVTVVLNTSAGSISRTLINTGYRAPEILLNTQSLYIKTGESRVVEASVKYSNLPTDKDLIWNSSNPEAISVDNTGKIQALKPGDAIITLVAKKDLTVRKEISVNAFAEEAIKVTGVKITPPEKTELPPDGVLQLVAQVSTSDGKSNINEILWNSSDPEIATVDPTGKVTALKEGTVTLSAQAANDFAQTDKLTLTVKKPVVTPVPTKIDLSKTYWCVSVGKSYPAVAEITMSDNTINKDVLWQTSDGKVLSIDYKGLMTGVSLGETTIVARSRLNPNLEKSYKIVVRKDSTITLFGKSIFQSGCTGINNPNTPGGV